MNGKPRKPSDERDEPYYTDSHCKDCGTELILYDTADTELLREAEKLNPPETTDTWYDEWICPECLDGIILDTP